MAIEIREKRPTGQGSIASVLDSIRKGEQSSEDLRDVWPGIIADLKDAMKYTFSKSNPARWDALSLAYRNWKIKKGYPATIGIKTGALKDALSENADSKIQKKRFVFRHNNASVSSDYAQYFSNRRPVFSYARNYINAIVKRSVQEAIKDGFNQ